MKYNLLELEVLVIGIKRIHGDITGSELNFVKAIYYNLAVYNFNHGYYPSYFATFES